MLPTIVTEMSLVVAGLCVVAFAVQAEEPALTRPKHPKVADRDWPRIPLDYFVLARLEAKGQKPPAEADKLTLLRRASLDLTGEAPTAGEIAAIAADKAWNAYEKAVDRLLATERYARFQADGWMKRLDGIDASKRGWLIRAFADDKPLDRLVREMSEDKRLTRDVRDTLLTWCRIERQAGESTKDALRRRPESMARIMAVREWRRLMKVDADPDPEIVDWLACELMQSTQIDCCHLEDPLPEPWAMKPFLKMIVTCAAYRSR
jgi:hypothetical protein